MKKTLFSLLAGAAILSAGCTQQPSTPAAPTSPARPTTPASTSAAPPSAAPASAAPASGSPAASMSGAPVANASGQAAENWQTFKSADGKMAVDTPVTLTEKPDPNEPNAKMYAGQGGEGNRTWEIGSQPIPPQLAKSKKPEEIMNIAIQSLCFSPDGKASTSPAEINGKKGLMAKHQRDDGAIIAVYVTVVGDEAFMARVITPKEAAGKVDFKSATRFVNSLQINKTASAGDASPAAGGDASPAGKAGGEKSDKGDGDKEE